MKYLVMAPKYNTPGRHDATGAFQPEARAFLRHHGYDKLTPYLVDNSKPKAAMREEVISIIKAVPQYSLEGVFFFCHGYRRGIQFGIDDKTVRDLVDALSDRFSMLSPHLALYSCDVGRDAGRDRSDDTRSMGGDGGFADTLRDSLCQHGLVWCTVDGHTTVGHCTRNPDVRRFEGNGSEWGGKGGFYIVPRSNKPLWRKWVTALKTEFRFDYPLLQSQEIYKHLGV